MMSRQVQLELVLRRALRRANILTGYRHICRRRGCGHVELAPDDDLRRCPKCKMKLWPAPQTRPLRFHDIRHTTASLLIMAGADLPAVQRIMRHTDPRITTEFYAHLSPGYLRSAIDRLAINPKTPDELPVAASAPLRRHRSRHTRRRTRVSLLHPCCRLSRTAISARGRRLRKTASLRRLRFERDSGFEPPTFSLGKRKGPFLAVTGSAK